jgi:hypothetical protein
MIHSVKRRGQEAQLQHCMAPLPVAYLIVWQTPLVCATTLTHQHTTYGHRAGLIAGGQMTVLSQVNREISPK